MAQKSNHAELNRIDELFDQDQLRRIYPNHSEETRIGLLQVRSADADVIKSRLTNAGDSDPKLVEVAQQRRQQLPQDEPMVNYYLKFIDSAFAQGI